MTVKELIDRLQTHSADLEVMILDGFNGGGCPREINLGPQALMILPRHQRETADCEDMKTGTTVIVLGYGCY